MHTSLSMTRWMLLTNFQGRLSISARANPHRYTKEQIEFIHANIRNTSYKGLHKSFNEQFGTNLTLSQIVGYLKRNKIRNGKEGRFQEGQESWNKGKKGLNIGGKETQFKKGDVPHNYMPVGTVRVNTLGYVDIKIADPNTWEGKQRIVWSEHNGPIPKGYNVIFADGNKRNFNIDNLILLSPSQLGIMNSHRLIYPDAELTRSGVAIAEVIGKVNELKKKS